MIIAEEAKIVSAIVPVDLQAAQDGDYISLKNYEHVSIVLFKGVGTAGDDPIVTLTQATSVAGAGAKALDFDKVWKNQRVALTASDALTRIASSSIPRSSGALNTFLDTSSAEEQLILIIEIDASELDVSNGFDCLKVAVSDVGTNAQLGCGFYFLSNPRYHNGTVQSSAIID